MQVPPSSGMGGGGDGAATFVLEGHDHTVGDLLLLFLQRDPDVDHVSYFEPCAFRVYAPYPTQVMYRARTLVSQQLEALHLDFDGRHKNLIKFVELDEEKFVGEVSAELPFLNALRRVVLGNVPTMAVEFVKFLRGNNTDVHDEMLAHRLGLVPLALDARNYRAREECECEPTEQNDFCPACSHTFEVDIRYTDLPPAPRGALRATSVFPDEPEVRKVLSQHLGREFAVCSDIEIVPLRPHQRLHIKMQAVRGVADVHNKWLAACDVAVTPVVRVVVLQQPAGVEDDDDEDMDLDPLLLPVTHTEDARRKRKLAGPPPPKPAFVQACPRNVFDVRESGRVVVARPNNCIMCQECTVDDAVSVTEVENKFRLTVETVGVLPPERIVTRAFFVLRDMIDRLEFAEYVGAATQHT